MTTFSAADLRRMLSHLRDVMAGVGAVQERLDKTVTLIAQGLKADVCSCYVMRAGEVLELFATFGLSQTAVHMTRLRVGEGLVGEIAAHARPIALADAWSHPQFVYRPETGEDFFRSLMGVPMIQGNALLATRLTGASLNAGIGIGVAVMHKPHVRIGRLVSDDPIIEERRLQNALDALRREVDAMINDAHGDASLYGDILEVYRMFADDRGWISRISEAIGSGLTAEAAVQRAHDDTRARMQAMTDPVLRERLQDLDDPGRAPAHRCVRSNRARRQCRPNHPASVGRVRRSRDRSNGDTCASTRSLCGVQASAICDRRR